MEVKIREFFFIQQMPEAKRARGCGLSGEHLISVLYYKK
jgi:hypothetical protein